MKGAAIVTSAAELGLADAIGDDPVEITQLAARVGADPDALTRLLRALISLGLFQQVAKNHYEHTEMSRTLRRDAPGGLIDTVLTGSDWGWATWGRLTDAVRSGKCIFPDLYGTDFFTHLGEHPAEQSRMFRGMTAWSDPMNPRLVEAMKLDRIGTVADVGAGRGTLLRTMLEHGSHLKGTWFDTEPTLAVVDEDLRAMGDRCTFVSGDFFQEVPFASDLYVFKLTLHMYEDGACERILRNCKAAAQPGARIVIADPLLTDPPEGQFVPTMDLHMLLVMGGRERTADDYEALFERCGLKLTDIIPTQTDLHLIEATVPV
jgi:C-methyltransferase